MAALPDFSPDHQTNSPYKHENYPDRCSLSPQTTSARQAPRDSLCLMPGSHPGRARAVTQRTSFGADRHSFETLSCSAVFVPALKLGPVLHLYSLPLCQQTVRFVRCPHQRAPRQTARAAPRLHGRESCHFRDADLPGTFWALSGIAAALSQIPEHIPLLLGVGMQTKNGAKPRKLERPEFHVSP